MQTDPVSPPLSVVHVKVRPGVLCPVGVYVFVLLDLKMRAVTLCSCFSLVFYRWYVYVSLGHIFRRD